MKKTHNGIPVTEIIEQRFLGELKELLTVQTKDVNMKFLLLVQAIEYLGACLDKYPFQHPAKGEQRFNTAIYKLFGKINPKYKAFVQKDNAVNLYRDLRCALVHQFTPNRNIQLINSDTSIIHLSVSFEGHLNVVLNDFIKDFFLAVDEVVKRLK